MGSCLGVCCNWGVREVGDGGAGRAMAMQRQEPGRDGGGQPPRHRKRRSQVPDCDVYQRAGVCVFGMTCLFNHPPECRQQLQFIPQEPDALDPDEYPPRPGNQIVETWLLANKLTKGLTTLSDLYHASLSSKDFQSHDTGPSCSLDPSSSSSATYFSGADGVQRGGYSRLDSIRELESVIEDSRVHWTELSSSNDSDSTGESITESDAGGNGERNREIFESLRQLPKYQSWLNCDVAPADISLGSKIAEGGQADIFEVEIRSQGKDLTRDSGHVLKVFKKGYCLQDLKSQWPDGLLFGGQLSTLFKGSMVLEDDRFALLLSRSDMDLRKLIDVTLDKDSPLFDHDGTLRLKELRAYKPKCARSKCSTPVFSEHCAVQIVYRVAKELEFLHSVDILHRDLKASNILCTRVRLRGISISVADYESSIGITGTAFWRAPEILKQVKERKREIHFTREADVYGFAMICYEIWTGHIPFEEYKHFDFDHVLNGARPTLPTHVPYWVEVLIQRCWHQVPSERPSFSAIVEELNSHSLLDPLVLSGSLDVLVAYAARSALYLERADYCEPRRLPFRKFRPRGVASHSSG